MFEAAKAWIKARWAERSSWDGLTIIGVSIALYVAHSLISWMVPWVALLGVGYGIYRLVSQES
jgi:hypothetical protein